MTAPAPADISIEYQDIDTIVFAEHNPKAHDEQSIDASMTRYGYTMPPAVNEATGRLVAGHGRILTLRKRKAEGREAPERVRVDGDRWLVPVIRGIRFASDQQALEYLLVDNKLSEAGGWVKTAYEDIVAGLEKAGANLREVGWKTDLDAIMKSIAGRSGSGGQDPGAAPPSINPVSKHGELYQLGPHRLMCGDSTKIEDVEKLLGGEVPVLLSTDPPYCVDYTGNDRPLHKGVPSGKDWSSMYREVDINDFGVFFDAVLTAYLPRIKEDSAIYVWHAHVQQPKIALGFEKHGLLLHQIVVWVKPTSTLGHAYFRWKHEPCAFGWKKGHKPLRGFGQEESVWEVDWEGKKRQAGNEHPTQKPLDLFARPIRFHTQEGDLVVEPFGGSGSQMIAAALEGRRCYSMELSPAFCDAIRWRWTKFAHSAGIDPGTGALEKLDRSKPPTAK